MGEVSDRLESKIFHEKKKETQQINMLLLLPHVQSVLEHQDIVDEALLGEPLQLLSFRLQPLLLVAAEEV